MLVSEILTILDNDLLRKADDTRTNYHYLAKKFLEESGDFTRQGIMRWFNTTDLSDNSLRTAFYALSRLCKALEIKFPLDNDDLPPKPDEDTMVTPTIAPDNIRRLIKFWSQYPGEYETSLLFMSSIFGPRACEMSTTQELVVKGKSIVICVAKRRANVTREHDIPEIYMPFMSGYRNMSENQVRYKFRHIFKAAGVKREHQMGPHSIRRCLATVFTDMAIPEKLWKRFMRWAPNNQDMASVYFHKDFEEVNGIMLGQIVNKETGQWVKHPFLELWIK